MKHPKKLQQEAPGMILSFLVFGTWGLARFQGCIENMNNWSTLAQYALGPRPSGSNQAVEV